jgi:glutathionylspermidine synthase
MEHKREKVVQVQGDSHEDYFEAGVFEGISLVQDNVENIIESMIPDDSDDFNKMKRQFIKTFNAVLEEIAKDIKKDFEVNKIDMQ